MRTKRYAALFLAAALALSLVGCGMNEDKNKNKDGDMTIQPTQLSEEETALTELLSLEMKSYRIFDFQVSGAKSVKISAYELVDGEWSSVTTGLGDFAPDGPGRIALMFGKMNEGVSVRYQGEHGGGGTQFAMPGGESTGLFYATSVLTDLTAVELEKEVPLAIQIATSQSEIDSYYVNYFEMPRELAKHNYEHVYAITVTFRANSVSGNSQTAPAAQTAEPSPAE